MSSIEYVNEYLEKFKHLCESGRFDSEEFDGHTPICNISTPNSNTYNFLVDEFNSYSYELIGMVTNDLLIDKGLCFKKLKLFKDIGNTFMLDGGHEVEEYSEHKKTNYIFNFCLSENGGYNLYIFVNYGIDNKIGNKKLKEKILNFPNLKFVTYVSMDDEIKQPDTLNEDNLNNFKTITLKEFYSKFIGEEEYRDLLKDMEHFKRKAKEFLNFEVIRTLKNSSIYSFKNMVINNIKNFNYEMVLPNISVQQHIYIRNRFLDGNLYKCMVGNSDFAKSFMTAEWLYTTMGNAKYIDLTTIALGYLKSIEQFLSVYVGCFVNKKNPETGQYYLIHKKGKNVSLTSDEYEPHYIELNNYINFFGFTNETMEKPVIRNSSFLNDGISKETNEELIKFIFTIAPLRNGYFHKDNIYDHSLVDNARDTAYCLYYLILGCHKKIEDFNKIFGVTGVDTSDKYKLCEFIYNNQRDLDILHLFRIDDNEEIFISTKSNVMEYDEYGTPQYKGISFSEFLKSSDEKFYDINCLPKEIKMFHIKIRPFDLESKDMVLNEMKKACNEHPEIFHLIYKDGKFLLD